jgi:hypothetical protein
MTSLAAMPSCSAIPARWRSVLAHVRANRAADNVPVAHGEGQHGLHVQDVRILVVIGAAAEIGVVLQRKLYIAATGFYAAAAKSASDAGLEPMKAITRAEYQRLGGTDVA